MDKVLTVYFDDKSLFNKFISVLENNKKITDVNLENKLILIDSNEKCVISCEHLLIICGKNTKYLPYILNNNDVTVILNSSCRLILTENQAKNYKFITCGFSSKDSVTISSITTDKSLISIQRGFFNFIGEKIEPMELISECNYKDCENMLEIVTAQLYCFGKNILELL